MLSASYSSPALHALPYVYLLAWSKVVNCRVSHNHPAQGLHYHTPGSPRQSSEDSCFSLWTRPPSPQLSRTLNTYFPCPQNLTHADSYGSSAYESKEHFLLVCSLSMETADFCDLMSTLRSREVNMHLQPALTAHLITSCSPPSPCSFPEGALYGNASSQKQL